MEIKNNVKHRRQQLLKRLQEGEAEHGELYPYEARMTSDSMLHPSRIQPAADMGPVYEAELDPEKEWKRKWQSQLGELHHQDGDRYTSQRPPRHQRFMLRLFLSGLLFGAVWGVFQLEHPAADGAQDWVRTAMSESFDTSRIAGWYHEQFGGSPSILPAIHPSRHQEAEKVASLSKHYFAPIKGELISSFTPEARGIQLRAASGVPVFAMAEGRVTYAGGTSESGYTVILQHADGLQTEYRGLAAGAAVQGDWLKGGETVGTLAAGQAEGEALLFFAVTKDGKAMNPADVISFD